MRILFFLAGWLFFVLGLLGVVLPVLPTTPFMLLALWAFARSSTRFHSWLYTHPWFGPSLQRWDKYRVIPPLGKLLSIGFMTASFLYMTIYVDLHPLLLALIAVVMLYAAWFILTKPSRVPGQGGAVITD